MQSPVLSPFAVVHASFPQDLLMNCPIDGSDLVMTERQGIEIDYARSAVGSGSIAENWTRSSRGRRSRSRSRPPLRRGRSRLRLPFRSGTTSRVFRNGTTTRVKITTSVTESGSRSSGSCSISTDGERLRGLYSGDGSTSAQACVIGQGIPARGGSAGAGLTASRRYRFRRQAGQERGRSSREAGAGR